MATLSITFGAQSASKTISAAHSARALDALRVVYGPVGTNGSTRPMTDAEVFDRWSGEIFAGLKTVTKSQEQSAAAKVASDAVAEITIS